MSNSVSDSRLVAVKSGFLCLRCQSVFSLPSGEVDRHSMLYLRCTISIDVSDLKEAAAQECYVCWRLFWVALQELDCAGNHHRQIFVGYYLALEEQKGFSSWYESTLGASLKRSPKAGLLGSTQIHFQRIKYGDTWTLGQLTSISTDSQETVDFVKRELKTCDEGHQLCATYRPKSLWYPTRLIDLEVSHGNSEGARVVLTTHAEIEGPYISLSHCWGSGNILKLTEATLAQLLARIPISQIPKTFSDAIKFTRALGIRYIWIDSLCIIQDSQEDWIHESSTMYMVYQHAYCNIAATQARNGDDGLFSNRPIPTDLELKYGSDCGIFRLFETHDWNRTINCAPLNQRGWVIQERIMSPRVIHFAKGEVSWDCYKFSACETVPTGDPGFMYFDGNKKKSLGLLNSSASELKRINTWFTIAQTYSASKLTFPDKDKIISISSVARYLEDIWGMEYCAGMWRAHLELQLAWRRDLKNGTRTSTPDKLRAPSWSWLSYDSRVSANFDMTGRDHAVARATKVQLEQGTSEADNIIIRGYIELLCVLFPMECDDEEKEEGYHWHLAGNLNDSKAILCSPDFDYSDSHLGPLFLIPLYITYLMFRKYCSGIIISQLEGPGENYVRCGMCQLDVHKAYDGRRKMQDLEKFCLDDKNKQVIRLV
ncbi:HET-domain-containing protein [Hyaloscypha variabilis F]|uniref:HET-domain-containing protein n=1 Tax=Hyaloscypha variabilis (strain UAMH 11265 / GT02V1 / F) TaxID=1149755 RepID=A0A2J6R1L0_HYAVF|nr:HET-domain-containing protein [Hyaloscypha variabilis F]